MEFLTSILGFVLAIGILVTVHEFGHFWVARRLGVKVLRFSVGFGNPLWSRTDRDGTEYAVAAIPLGGYVKMLDEREGEVDPAEAHRAFNRQGRLVRAAIVAAGPVLNYIFAILAFWLVYTVGEIGVRPVVGAIEPASVAAETGFAYGDELVEIGGQPVASWEQALYALLAAAVDAEDLPLKVKRENGSEAWLYLTGSSLGELVKDDKGVFRQLGLHPMGLPPVIGEIVEGKAAQQAGLAVGDRILSSDGESIPSWSEWVRLIRDRPGLTLNLTVLREGRELALPLRVGVRQEGGKEIGWIGAAVQVPKGHFERMRSEVRYDPLTALRLAIGKTGELSWLTLKVMGKMVTGDASVHNLSGPITIAQAAGKTVGYGFIQFLKFLALVSVSLAVLNLLPVPVLDGGHLLYILIESIKGEPLSEKVQEQAQRIGIALLISLMLLAFYVDLIRLFSKG
ncbi:MAG: RIP metalloprotease RseP [Gammaproteobacteria bacterium]|nr:RIP metalloprotease RseP [Gammaproteobacteria bacterium]MBU1656096.1 RIP metalloprotease RseP [Gammaproteobacteria bacterium]MBU1962181.1 RIP metalloprotease RseP [Gammaproteobacteria bacterium]